MLSLSFDRYELRRGGGRQKLPWVRTKLFQTMKAAEVILLAFKLERSGGRLGINGHAADGIDRAVVSRVRMIMHVVNGL